ncbi:MAG: Lrp/AsnC ligand binding domain-containing protein [Cyanobacteriota bacterium]|jgi:DNA-binding Lrp family transcriptional regulator
MDLELLDLLFDIGNKYSFPAFCFILLLLIAYYISQQKQETLQQELINELRSKTSNLESQLAIIKDERNRLQVEVRNRAFMASQLAELNEMIKSTDRPKKLLYIIKLSQRHEDELRYFNVSPIKVMATDKSLGVRRYAAKLLARIKTKSSFEALLGLVTTDSHPAIRVYSLYLCGKYLPESDELKKFFRPSIQQIYDCNLSPLLSQEAAWVMNKIDNSFVYSQTYKPSNGDGKCLAFVLIKGLAPSNQTLTEDFARINKLSKYGVMDFGVVYGTYSTIIKVLSDNINDLNQTILRDLQDLPWVDSTRTLIVINEPCISYWYKAANSNSTKSMSYVLISTPASDTHGLISCLWDYDFSHARIIEAAGVYGEVDVLARIEADSDQDRDNLICRIIKELSPLVKSCEVLTVQTGTFDQDDILRSGCLFKSLHIGEIPEEYVPLPSDLVEKYSTSQR